MLLHSSCVPPLAPASLAAAPFVCILLCALHRFECTFEASPGGGSVPAVAPTGARTHDRRDPKSNALTAALSRVWLSSPARGRTSTVFIVTSCAHGPVSQRAPPSRSAMRVRACVCVCVCVCVRLQRQASSRWQVAQGRAPLCACSWPSLPLIIISQNLLSCIRKATITNTSIDHIV